MKDREIIIGNTTHIPVRFRDRYGRPIDFTLNSRIARLRLTTVGSTTPLYTLDTTDSAEFTWTSQANGEGEWLFESSTSYTAGTYEVTVTYTDPSPSPDTVVTWEGGRYTVRQPTTGAL